jgi:hypothetical protein
VKAKIVRTVTDFTGGQLRLDGNWAVDDPDNHQLLEPMRATKMVDETIPAMEKVINDVTLPTLRAKARVLAPMIGTSEESAMSRLSRVVSAIRVQNEALSAGRQMTDASHDDNRGDRQMTDARPDDRADDQIWLFRNRVVLVEAPETSSPAEVVVAVKHAVLSQERDFARMQSDIDRFQRFAEAANTPRDPIPTAVKVFVWRRDQGRCIKCGSTENLEFDHIIPQVKGGSNTERNIQLLCLACNRSKGSVIG